MRERERKRDKTETKIGEERKRIRKLWENER